MNEIENIISQLERQKVAIETAIEALRQVSGVDVNESTPTQVKETKTARSKRHISPEGRKRIAEATRKRWAARRAADKAAAKVPVSARKTRKTRTTVKKKAA